MNKFWAFIAVVGFISDSTAFAADYAVGIVGVGTEFENGGTALNLYEVKKSKLELIETYVLKERDFTGNFSKPLTLAHSPAHDFVYVAYTGQSQPNIIGFKITPNGLVREWERELLTGDAGLQGTTLTAGPDYVIENTYPFGLWVRVVSQAGKELLVDAGTGGDATSVVSGHVDPTRSFYYSCRALSGIPPATSVSIFDFKNGVDVSTGVTPAEETTTDPVFLQAVCM